MASHQNRNLLAVIGDEVCLLSQPPYVCSITQDSVTGLLLAGIGNVGQNQTKNFLVVDSSA